MDDFVEDLNNLLLVAKTDLARALLSAEREKALAVTMSAVRGRDDAPPLACSTTDVPPPPPPPPQPLPSQLPLPPPSPAALPAAAAALAPVTLRFERYSWDQTVKSVTLYVPLEGVGSWAEGAVVHAFGERSFELRARDPADAGNCRELKFGDLCHAIDATRSKLVLKADRIQLKLVKREAGVEWSDLDAAKDRKKAERDARINDGDLKDASTQELLADMFQNASDEERNSLKSAAFTGARKREGGDDV